MQFRPRPSGRGSYFSIGTTTQYAWLPGLNFQNSYSYDAASNRTSLTAPDTSVTSYGYDTLNRLNGLGNTWAGSFGFGYDALSRRTSLTRPNGVNTSYSYDSVSHLLSVLHQAGVNTLDGASYTYDPAGNRSSKTNYLNGVTSNYGYDLLYELTQVTQGTSTTESYSYDAVGNRLSSLGVPTYNYNSSNELTSSSSGSYTYDNNGNALTDAQGRQYTWDFENRLVQAVNPGVGTTTFKYDPFGRRIQKSGPLGTTNYLYDGANDIEEVDSAGNILARYTAGRSIDEPLAELRSGSTSFYEQDGLGSVGSLSSGTGALTGTYTYDSFGNLTASTGSVTNPLRYTAREFDQETGIYQYRARYYDPSAGRFVSEDPFRFAAGMNFFAYVHNNPVVLDDPMGLCDKNNCRLSISCGPTPRTEGFSHCTVTIQNGDTYTAYDAGETGGKWYGYAWGDLRFAPPGKGRAPGPDSFVKNVPVPCDCAQKAANDINSSNMVYSAPFQNSNTAAAMMAADCGVYPDSWPKGAWGAHGPIGATPPINSNPWSPFNPWPLMQ